ncbi:hypothetical protein [Sulfurospirillum arcachonense]|nr:hypothetical protein [Sulfurospirillum arcachonense]
MKLLGKVEIIVQLKEKIEQIEPSSKKEAKKLRKLLEKLTKSADVSFI